MPCFQCVRTGARVCGGHCGLCDEVAEGTTKKPKPRKMSIRTEK